MRFCYASCVFIQYFSLRNTHIVSLYTLNVVLLSYLMVLIYISVPVCTLCRRGQNIDEKYDQCTFLLDLAVYSVLSQASWCKQTCTKQAPPTQLSH